jgi:hypothetical protein
MRKNHIYLILAVLCLAFFCNSAYAKEVVVTGRGPDMSKAYDSAYRNAVEKSLGGYIRSETRVENHQLIEDKILSISAGYIKNFDYLEGGCKSGSCYVKIKANVDFFAVKAELIKNQIEVVDGEQTYARVKTSASAMKDRVKVFRQVWQAEYPRDFIDVKFNYKIWPNLEKGDYAILEMTDIEASPKRDLLIDLQKWVDEGSYKNNKALFNELFRRGFPVKMPGDLRDYRWDSGYWAVHLIFHDKKGRVIHKVTEEQRLDWFNEQGNWEIHGGPASSLKKDFIVDHHYDMDKGRYAYQYCGIWPEEPYGKLKSREYNVPMWAIGKAYAIEAVIVDTRAGEYNPRSIRSE